MTEEEESSALQESSGLMDGENSDFIDIKSIQASVLKQH